MCGIAGIVTKNQMDTLVHRLRQAEQIQIHRGPDAQGTGIYQSGEWSVGLAHQRLSILDVSEMGTQPMVYAKDQSILIYNGEVYNYKEIRQELERLGHHFVSDTDTEVVLTALHQWGVDDALARFNGMWAFAWLDQRVWKLYLCRDRFGVKPLYYAITDGELVFSSELKTILELVKQPFSLNYQRIGEYIQQSLLATSEESFFEGIQKIPPHHTLCFDLKKDSLSGSLHAFWSFPAQDTCKQSNESDLVEEIRELFTDAVRLRMRSDVPVGVLLSGGVDSSSIASVMDTLTQRDGALHMLSAVSVDSRFDESPFIDMMSQHLKRPVDKVVLDFAPEQAFDYLEQVTWYNDEPISSFSTIAHYLLMEQAKKMGITVILSGQGADELLCGYRKYLGFYVQSLLRQGQIAQAPVELFRFWKQGTILNQFSMSEAKRYLPSVLKPKEIEIAGEALRQYRWIPLGLASGMSVEERQALDIRRFSVPALTHYEDRMSMAWSREVRLPFLDYRLIEKLLPLTPALKMKDGWTKYVFRKAMEPLLPEQIAWRKDKQGFVNPQSEWLKRELREGVLRYFQEDSLIFSTGIIDRKKLLAKYEQYCKQSPGKGGIWFRDIFNPLALEIWLRRFYRYRLIGN